jgi:hypothetical protein
MTLMYHCIKWIEVFNENARNSNRKNGKAFKEHFFFLKAYTLFLNCKEN